MKKEARFFIVVAAVLSLTALRITAGDAPGEGVRRIPLLPPGKGNPRNSEGDLLRLRDGRLMLVYTHFTGGGGDHAAAHLAARFSDDDGATWTAKDEPVVSNEGEMNIMSVSLLRLRDGRAALFYLRKHSLADCRPVMRTSTDDARTWSKPVAMIPDDAVGYYVMNNDRVVRLACGRLVAPLSRHHGPGWKKWTPYGNQVCYLSDDGGRTWRRSRTVLTGERAGGKRTMLQEPGVVALKDGRLMMWCRTAAGCQYVSYSDDRGDTWSPARPSGIRSPRSPASIERIPATGDLLMVWNDHRDVPAALKNKRTPLTAAVSTDEGRTWGDGLVLYDDPRGWYCYTAIAFAGDHVVLAHCAGRRHLAQTTITRFPVRRLYGGAKAAGK